MPQAAVGVMTKPPASLTQTGPVQSVARVATQVNHTATASVRPRMAPQGAERESEYIPLETCSSGNSIKRPERPDRQESISSVPEDIAPPPPLFKPGEIENEVFNYDVPPSVMQDEDEFYKVPPSRFSNNTETLEAYDVPPPTRNSPSTPRSSSSESQKADSAYSSQGLMYDVPPVRPEGLTEDDVYDVPPSHASNVLLDDIPPSRPPKPGHLQTVSNSQEAYMNLPTNSKLFTEKTNKGVDINSVVTPPPAHSGMVLPTIAMSKMDLYDVPKSTLDNLEHSKHLNGDMSDKLLMSTPPPPTVCRSGDHKYINTQGSEEAAHDMYLPMDPSVTSSETSVGKPRTSSSTDNEVEYTDMSGDRGTSLYDHPPPTRPTMPPPRPNKPASSTYIYIIIT